MDIRKLDLSKGAYVDFVALLDSIQDQLNNISDTDTCFDEAYDMCDSDAQFGAFVLYAIAKEDFQ